MGDFLIRVVINLTGYWILILMMQYVCAASMNLGRRNVAIGSCIVLLGTWVTGFCPVPNIDLAGMLAEIFLSVLLFSKRRGRDLLRFFPAFSIYFFLDVVPCALMEELLPEAMLRPVIKGTPLTLLFILTDGALLFLLLILRHVQIRYRVRISFSAREVLGSIALLFFAFIDGAFIVMLNREEVRKMRHDLNRHLAVISSLCEEGNYEEVRRYTEQLGQGMARINDKILTGNQVADLVMASKRRACEEYGIAFEFTGTMKNLDVMEAPDICGMLANAYDNAIEACLAQEHGYIRTRVSTTGNYTVIEIINSVERKVSVRGNSVVTTKKDRKAHGYGIEIMKQIAQKYNGSCTVSCDGKEFSVKLVLLT